MALLSFQRADTSGLFAREKIRTFYLEKMAQFHAGQIKKCRQNALEMARSQVDSVLSGTELLMDTDTFSLLPRPDKPEKPEFDFEPDSIEVDPLFEFDSLR